MDIFTRSNGLMGSAMDVMDADNDDILEHYGTKRHSGRYPWGSGDNPHQHEQYAGWVTSPADFLHRVEALEKQGKSDKDIARELEMEIKELRVYKAVAKREQKAEMVHECMKLYSEGKNKVEIGKELGIPDTTVGLYLRQGEQSRRTRAQATADVLKEIIDERGKAIDIGLATEHDIRVPIDGDPEHTLGVSRNMLDEAAIVLQAEGYPVYNRRVPNGGNMTVVKVACPPGTERGALYQDGFITTIEEYHSNDGGETFHKTQPPASLDSKRIAVRYAEEGGIDKDGVIEIRRGVEDLSLGNSHYAQVRILVDGDNYIKGMALYSDDVPEGYDILINSNKKKGTPLLSRDGKSGVLKPAETIDGHVDTENPFGALIKMGDKKEYRDPETGEVIKITAGGQYEYRDPKTGEMKLSPLNKTREEGDWDKWSRTLPAQFLAKQPLEFIKTQLDLTVADKEAQLEDIMKLENPALRKKYLMDFAGECDDNAVTLSAVSVPRQAYQVILPLNISDDEVYAPNYKDGEKVALVRFPHQNTGEIPILTVNNKSAEGKKVMGAQATDAIGISQATANRLSGADFDGDTVMVLPTGYNRRTNVKNRDPLSYKDENGVVHTLAGFEPKLEYAGVVDHYNDKGEPVYAHKIMKKGAQTQRAMGEVSNLMMDMTLKGAPDEDLVKVSKHSQVVIDAAKHKLDYQASYRDNDIAAITKRWKGHIDEETGKYSEGASTLITKSTSETRVDLRRGSGRIDKQTGELTYNTAPDFDRYYTDSKGKTHERQTKVPLMSVTKDPYILSSGTPQENLYAGFSSKMKGMANDARKAAVNTPTMAYSKTAAAKYAPQVSSLEAKLLDVEKNKPRERQAELLANDRSRAKVKLYKDDHPELDKTAIKKYEKKVRTQEMNKARNEVGAKSIKIFIEPDEWEAIQAGAIHDTKQQRIFMKADAEQLRNYAMPKRTNTLSKVQQNKINALARSGYSNTEIAESLGISTSTVHKYLNPDS